MARLRYNGLTATLGADLLTADTSVTFTAALSSAAGAVPTLGAGDYIPFAVLDSAGAVLEVLHLTAYTEAATTGTVLRAQEGTTAADHASGLTLVHGPTVDDFSGFVPAGGALGDVLTKASASDFDTTWAASGGGGGGAVWSTGLENTFATDMTGFTSSGGTWGIAAGVLKQTDPTSIRVLRSTDKKARAFQAVEVEARFDSGSGTRRFGVWSGGSTGAENSSLLYAETTTGTSWDLCVERSGAVFKTRITGIPYTAGNWAHIALVTTHGGTEMWFDGVCYGVSADDPTAQNDAHYIGLYTRESAISFRNFKASSIAPPWA